MKFKPGEVAILKNLTGTDAKLNGREVMILRCEGPLTSVEGLVSIWWRAVAPWMSELHPHVQWMGISELCLRKRRPPPDWRAIAGAKDRPREVEAA